jgi:diaminopimelate epimerase
MKLKFTKMHGAGNDFIVIDAINQVLDLNQMPWKRLADRRFGIGADQILVVQAPEQCEDNRVDFRYRIFNADGGEVEQCGNGSRAFVKFVVEKGLSLKRCIRVSTLGGVLELTLTGDGQVCVNMGPPRLHPDQVPFDIQGLQGQTEGGDTLWPLSIDGNTVWVSVLSMGNPHAVQVVADVDQIAIAHCGPQIEHHPRFSQRVNAGFMQIMQRQKIKLRVYERGAGETLACGTGSCAAVVAGIRRGVLDSPVTVQARGGELCIAWAGGTAPVFMTGPAVSVFEGEIDL